jgi:hypothetical protein
MQNLTNSENAVLGGCTAVVVGLSLQPTLFWKNAAQQGKPFTVNPRVIYRGLGAALTAEIGQMGLQFFLTSAVKKIVAGSADKELSAVEEMSSALLGGAISAIYTSPVELVMIQQQNFAGSLPGTALRLIRQQGLLSLSRGILATSSRDAVYTLGLLGMCPVLQKKFQRDFRCGESTAAFFASCVGGSICGAISCPFDAVKTCMQGDVEQNTYRGFLYTWKTCYRQGRLFGGVGWRVVNISGTLVIANEFRIRVSGYMFPGKAVACGGGHH